MQPTTSQIATNRRGRRAIESATWCESLEARRMLCMIHAGQNVNEGIPAYLTLNVDATIKKGSDLWKALHGATAVQDTKPNVKSIVTEPAPAALNALVGSQPTGMLTGKIVYA